MLFLFSVTLPPLCGNVGWLVWHNCDQTRSGRMCLAYAGCNWSNHWSISWTWPRWSTIGQIVVWSSNSGRIVSIQVVKYWPNKGKSGFLVWRFLLRRDDPTPAPWTREGKKRIKELDLTIQVSCMLKKICDIIVPRQPACEKRISSAFSDEVCQGTIMGRALTQEPDSWSVDLRAMVLKYGYVKWQTHIDIMQ